MWRLPVRRLHSLNPLVVRVALVDDVRCRLWKLLIRITMA